MLPKGAGLRTCPPREPPLPFRSSATAKEVRHATHETLILRADGCGRDRTGVAERRVGGGEDWRGRRARGGARRREAVCRTRLYPRSCEALRLLRRTRLWVRVRSVLVRSGLGIRLRLSVPVCGAQR